MDELTPGHVVLIISLVVGGIAWFMAVREGKVRDMDAKEERRQETIGRTRF